MTFILVPVLLLGVREHIQLEVCPAPAIIIIATCQRYYIFDYVITPLDYKWLSDYGSIISKNAPLLIKGLL